MAQDKKSLFLPFSDIAGRAAYFKAAYLKQLEVNSALEQRIDALERRVALNSKTNSRPPSSDGLKMNFVPVARHWGTLPQSVTGHQQFQNCVAADVASATSDQNLTHHSYISYSERFPHLETFPPKPTQFTYNT